MSEQQDELQGWKQKYFDAVGNLEAKEKQWGEVEQVLRQGISRLSLVADNSDRELNHQLESLRGALRGSSSEALQAELGAISDTILRLDEARKKQPKLPTPAELLSDLIGRIRFPGEIRSRATALQKQLNDASSVEMPPLADEFVTLVGESLESATGMPVEAAKEEGKHGLFGKLFGSKDEGGEVAAVKNGIQLAKSLLAELIATLVEEEASRSSLNEKLQASKQEAQLQQLAHELAELLRGMGGDVPAMKGALPVNEVLVRLLERLDIPAELDAEVAAVKSMLLQTLPPDEVEKVIVAIAELISEMRSRMQSEKAEIESFLKQLTTRLQEIDSSFQTNVATQRESFRDGQALDDAVKVQVEGIEESVQQAEELTALKELVKQRVDTIRTHMQEFRDAEEQRLQQAEQQVEELTEKLESVQDESKQLRQRLQDEHNQAMIDTLTGIPNRLAYNERLAQEVARWQRYKSPLVTAVWDVDHFKSVNDNYGHQAGDKVLTVIGKVLYKSSRETDFVARFGGEEFVMLMPETDLESAVVAAENLRKAIEDTEFHFRGKRVPITISCGLSEFRLGDTPEQVFERADKALYEAKDSGRNCCCKG
jgi:diguanylate cyclase